MKLQRIIDVMESIAPVESAYEWDNVGLMIGLPDSEISKILIFISSYLIASSGYYEYSLQTRKNLTEESIKQSDIVIDLDLSKASVFNIKKMPTIYNELDITKKEYQNFVDSKTSEENETENQTEVTNE